MGFEGLMEFGVVCIQTFKPHQTFKLKQMG
jgi:hypothetical protein